MVAFTIISLESDIAQRLPGASEALPPGRAATPANTSAGRIARAALRLLIERQFPGSDCHIRVDARGKPYASRSSGPGPEISLSHTRGWVACAVSTHPVGIDIERHRARDHLSIAEYAFGTRENALVRDRGLDGFYRVWTVREAIAKATGDGLALVTDRHDRAYAGPDEGRWIERDERGIWLLAYMKPAPAISAAIAVLASGKASWTDEPFEEVETSALLGN